MKRLTIVSAFVGGLTLAISCTVLADVILVGAPTDNNFSSWDTQSNVPPSGPVFDFADEFSLSSNQFVTEIRMSLFGATGFLSTPFNLSLVTNLTSSSPLYSADLTLPDASVLFSLPINAVLSSGTYFLRITTDGFVGWPVADATSFVTTFGSVSDGIWERNPFSGTWSFLAASSTSVFDSHPGVFSVLGPSGPDGTVPEPSSVILLLASLAGGLVARRRRVRN